MEIHLVQFLIFTTYWLIYLKSGVKSLSMSAYEHGWLSIVGFIVFMISTAVPFTFYYEGQTFWLLGYEHHYYHIAAFFLMCAGFSAKHKEKGVKQVHHVCSTLAIVFGFLGLGSIDAAVLFGVSVLLLLIFKVKKRFLWWLEINAFYIIIIFDILITNFNYEDYIRWKF